MISTKKFILAVAVLLLFSFITTSAWSQSSSGKDAASARKHLGSDTIALDNVVVTGKSKGQRIKESAYDANALDVKSKISSLNSISSLIGLSTGINIRTEGGLGSDYSLSINGMSGNSVRYFVDGMPLSTKGSNIDLSNFPINTVERIEVYKGVVPAFLGGDALGGAINIVTKKEAKDFIDAAISVGSFSTYMADFTSQFRTGKYGIILRPQLSVNYSRNNYKVHGVEVWNDLTETYDTVSRRRFHDRYFSAVGQMEAGVEHTSWADHFFVGASYSCRQKELQTGSVQTIVYGKAQTMSDAISIQARYRKRDFLTKNLSVIMSLSHTWDHTIAVDTAFQRYDWNGNFVASARNETNGKSRQYRHYKRPVTSARLNASYALTDQHSLTLNYMLTRTGNKRYDTVTDYYTDPHDYDVTFQPSNDVLEKHIIGLSYDQQLIDDRLVNAFFIKDYINHVDVEQNDLAWITHADKVASHTVKNNIGFGFASRYKAKEWLALKLSYERAVRLPQAKELLGNGTTIYPNLSINPEKSHNMNLGVFGTVALAPFSSLYYECNVFNRVTQDYIHLSVNEADGTAQYENINDVTTRGCEAEVRYSLADWLQCTANVSYQESRDMEMYLDSGNKSATYKNRVPNKPWLCGNGELTLMKNGLFTADDRLRFNYTYQYVHWFYLTWEGYGYRASKSKIPTQHLQGASLTYSWAKERYNVTIACDNIFDRLCYDNFRLQKPGRSFMAKLRLYLK